MFGQWTAIDKLISSLAQLRSSASKYSHNRYAAFEALEEWSRKNNNIAIEDFALRSEQLLARFNSDFGEEEINSIKNVSNMFKQFKKFDSDLRKFKKYHFLLAKKEEKYVKKMTRPSKIIRAADYQDKYLKIKRDRELAEIKISERANEIESTKSIVFKSEMKKFNEMLQRRNQAEQVLISAMKDLLDQIPDVSSHEVDDLCAINYENKEICAEICLEAKKRMATLSASRIRPLATRLQSLDIEDELNGDFDSRENSFRSPIKTTTLTSVRSNSSVNIPPPPPDTRRSAVSIFPRLDFIPEIANESVDKSSLTPPPPTYSDSESQYSCMRNSMTRRNDSSFTVVTPSAPSVDEQI